MITAIISHQHQQHPPYQAHRTKIINTSPDTRADGDAGVGTTPPKDVMVWALPAMVVPIIVIDAIVDAGLRQPSSRSAWERAEEDGGGRKRVSKGGRKGRGYIQSISISINTLIEISVK